MKRFRLNDLTSDGLQLMPDVVQGRGVRPIDGTDHPIETGDVILVEAGEDHHTTSSVEHPLVAVWYLFDR
jgi:hypothetical protein